MIQGCESPVESPTIATYPSVGGRRETRGMRVPRKEYAWSRHQRLFEENVGKTGKDAIYELLVKGSGVVFTHGEGISTPHARPKGRHPSIECANMTLIFMFPFMFLYPLYPFYIFSFCGRQGCFPLLLRIPQFGMRKSDLRSSFLSSDSFSL